MEEYFKQNANRHKSEKMLDKFIYKTEKVKIYLFRKNVKN
jgi:hypothetical protein